MGIDDLWIYAHEYCYSNLNKNYSCKSLYTLLSIKLDNFCEIKSNYKVASGEMKLQTQKVQLWVFASKLKTVKESSYHQKIYFYTVVNGMVVRKSAQKFHWSLGFCY